MLKGFAVTRRLVVVSLGVAKLPVGREFAETRLIPGASLLESVTSTSLVPSPGPVEVREAVLSGPGSGLAEVVGVEPLAAVLTAQVVAQAVVSSGVEDDRRGLLDATVIAVLVAGLCLFTGEGYDGVLARMWPLLAGFKPATLLSPPVSGAGLSKARAWLPAAVMKALFEAGARAGAVETIGCRVFGLLVTAVDGTVFDLPNTAAVRARYQIPSAGRFPQARVVTLVACGTRKVVAAVMDSCAVSEQALWDRLVASVRVGTLCLADRNFFAMHRWQVAAGTGAHLAWRVKNGHKSLPAKVIGVLVDGSALVRLRESDAMLRTRRKAVKDPKAARLPDITARLVEFTVTVTDEAGRRHTSLFRVLSTLLDPQAYPAQQIAALYAERWQVELVYKTIKSTLRGPGRRLRGESADLCEQELWGFLAVYNTVVDHAVAAAVDLGIDPDRMSFTAVLHAVRDHLTSPGCRNCGHRPTPGDLVEAIIAGPRNRSDRHRTSPRTTKDRETQHTRNVEYTITIEESTLPKTT